jgi:hypothetical protein
MSTYPLASSIRAVASNIDPTPPSVSKWNPVRDVLADALNESPDDFYITTVSKPGNLSVRLGQSESARTARFVGAMYTGDHKELPQCIEAAVTRCAGRELILVFIEDAMGWTLDTVVKPTSVTMPAVLVSEYPGANVVNC